MLCSKLSGYPQGLFFLYEILSVRLEEVSPLRTPPCPVYALIPVSLSPCPRALHTGCCQLSLAASGAVFLCCGLGCIRAFRSEKRRDENPTPITCIQVSTNLVGTNFINLLSPKSRFYVFFTVSLDESWPGDCHCQ